MAPLAANIIICEAVLTEQTSGVISLIRTMNVLNVFGGAQVVRFFTVTFLNSNPGDFFPHTIQVQMVTQGGGLISSSPEQKFTYGYMLDSVGPGASTLTTEFNLNLEPLGDLGAYMLVAYVDRERAAATPLIIRRR